MIVPRSRLLMWVALIVLPFGLIGAVIPSAAVISICFVAALGVIVLADALAGGKSVGGIGVQLPEVVRMSKDREAKIELRIRNERQKEKIIRLALPLPREIHSENEEMMAKLPEQSEWSRLDWTCRPRKRGNYRLQIACVEASSPLGFWGIRRRVPCHLEIRVYPNLLSERKNLAALFLNRGTLGIHAQRQIGKGRDFEKLRDYIPGDGYDEIHWKATAKRGKPVTKIFQIERTQELYVIVDASRLTARAQLAKSNSSSRIETDIEKSDQAETTVLERFVTAALVLGLAAEQQGDLFGLITFSDKVNRFVRARNGDAHYSACRDALYTLQPQPVTPDFDELSTFIRLR